jgi:hypothetical protein
LSDRPNIKSIYRIARTFPPGDDEYLTARQRYGSPAPQSSDAVKRSWDGLSAYDSLDRARRKAKQLKGRFGSLIVRYDIPEGSGITWEASFGGGHHDLFGNVAELKHFLTDEVTAV